jgi:hypothetical protein
MRNGSDDGNGDGNNVEGDCNGEESEMATKTKSEMATKTAMETATT